MKVAKKQLSQLEKSIQSRERTIDRAEKRKKLIMQNANAECAPLPWVERPTKKGYWWMRTSDDLIIFWDGERAWIGQYRLPVDDTKYARFQGLIAPDETEGSPTINLPDLEKVADQFTPLG